MKIYGLIGKTLEHSWSKAYFEKKFEADRLESCTYQNFCLEDISGIRSLVSNHPDISGLNVTFPYKAEVIPFIDELHHDAAAIGAVNCIRAEHKGGKPWLKGFNTDHQAFQQSLAPLLHPAIKKAILLGTGGASRAVQYALRSMNVPYLCVSRNPKPGAVTYGELTDEVMRDHLLVINATPAGMSGIYQDICPDLPYHSLTSKHLLFDLVYNPYLTHFLSKGKEMGCSVKNGYEMLTYQAELSWEIWNS